MPYFCFTRFASRIKSVPEVPDGYNKMNIKQGVIEIRKIKCRYPFYCYGCRKTKRNIRYEWRVKYSFRGESVANGYNFNATNWAKECLRCISQKALLLEYEVKQMKEVLQS